jgi:hypothetical protein
MANINEKFVESMRELIRVEIEAVKSWWHKCIEAHRKRMEQIEERLGDVRRELRDHAGMVHYVPPPESNPFVEGGMRALIKEELERDKRNRPDYVALWKRIEALEERLARQEGWQANWGSKADNYQYDVPALKAELETLLRRMEANEALARANESSQKRFEALEQQIERLVVRQDSVQMVTQGLVSREGEWNRILTERIKALEDQVKKLDVLHVGPAAIQALEDHVRGLREKLERLEDLQERWGATTVEHSVSISDIKKNWEELRPRFKMAENQLVMMRNIDETAVYVVVTRRKAPEPSEYFVEIEDQYGRSVRVNRQPHLSNPEFDRIGPLWLKR